MDVLLLAHDPSSGYGNRLCLFQEPPFIAGLNVASVYNKASLNKLGCCGKDFPCQIYSHSLAADVGELQRCQTREARFTFGSFLWGTIFVYCLGKNRHQYLWEKQGICFPFCFFFKLTLAIKLQKTSEFIMVHENFFFFFQKGWRLKAGAL